MEKGERKNSSVAGGGSHAFLRGFLYLRRIGSFPVVKGLEEKPKANI
jgi:hypothetical protein